MANFVGDHSVDLTASPRPNDGSATCMASRRDGVRLPGARRGVCDASALDNNGDEITRYLSRSDSSRFIDCSADAFGLGSIGRINWPHHVSAPGPDFSRTRTRLTLTVNLSSCASVESALYGLASS